jgi:hypothetical protein
MFSLNMSRGKYLIARSPEGDLGGVALRKPQPLQCLVASWPIAH